MVTARAPATIREGRDSEVRRASPTPLAAQLPAGGRLVQPIGPGGNEQVVLFGRSAAGLQQRQVLTLARFVRLHGRYGFRSRS